MFSLTLILTSLFYLSCGLQFSSDIDVSTLSELPLERLLQVQRTFIDDDYKSDNLTNENVPQALPLQGIYVQSNNVAIRKFYRHP